MSHTLLAARHFVGTQPVVHTSELHTTELPQNWENSLNIHGESVRSMLMSLNHLTQLKAIEYLNASKKDLAKLHESVFINVGINIEIIQQQYANAQQPPAPGLFNDAEPYKRSEPNLGFESPDEW